MFCAISGAPPEDPVVSRASGVLFEKRLIEKTIAETGECPVTKQPLSVDDLLPVKTNKAVKPRTGGATSIPGLLSLFHNEWDALMLETHQLREALDARNKELATALYQYDASCRVIARLQKERDEARAALASAPLGGGKRAADGADGGSTKRAKGGITPDVIQAMTDTAATLSKGRKKRPMPADLAPSEALSGMKLADTVPLHKTAQAGGICAIAISPANPNVFVTAGGDKAVCVYNKAEGKKAAVLEGHKKKVTDVKFAADGVLVSASADKTVRLWKPAAAGGYSCAATLTDHTDEVNAVAVHATGTYAVTLSSDSTWCFYDLPSATCLTQVADPSVSAGYTCGSFHPDGLILGTGCSDSTVRIWDAKSQKEVAKFEGHAGAITALAFSENGYHLASAAADGVKLWDLRKLLNFKSLQPFGGEPALSLDFDISGLFLAVGGADARVYGVKEDFAVVKTFDAAKKPVSALRFGPDRSFILAGSGTDHNLRIFA